MSRILLAEDDRVSRVMLQAVLTKWGHEVVAASDGTEALRILSDPSGPSLAILDWMMPGMTGLEICRQLRLDPSRRQLHLILLTARSKGSEAAEALEAGADDHLAKPYDLAELQARIHLGLRRVENQAEPAPAHGADEGRIDQMLGRVVAKCLPLNRIALRAILADPGIVLSPSSPGSCDLSRVVPAAVSDAATLLADRVGITTSGTSVVASASADAVVQIVSNILVHARMASPETGMSARFSWRREGSQAVLGYVDDGPRLLPEDIPLLTWPFTSLRNQSAAPGFGLFFALQTAEAVGGTMRCDAAPEGGLEISIRLPAADG